MYEENSHQENSDKCGNNALKIGNNTSTKVRKRINVHNYNRSTIFRRWLLETFGDFTETDININAISDQSGIRVPLPPSDHNNVLSHILDIAGGKGETSLPLSLSGFRCTLIDPRICDWEKNAIVKNLSYHLEKKDTKTYLLLKKRLAETRRSTSNKELPYDLDKDGIPFPTCIREYFTSQDPTFSYENDKLVNDVSHRREAIGRDSDGPIDYPDSTLEVSSSRQLCRSFTCESSEMTKAKLSATLLIGMHSDEATEPIVVYGLKHKIAFAVIPCCVFPEHNTHRKHPVTGGPVRTYDEFVEYLHHLGEDGAELGKPYLEGNLNGDNSNFCSPHLKRNLIQKAVLPFEGRNVVLYYKP